MKNPVKFRSLFGGGGARTQSRKSVNHQDYTLSWGDSSPSALADMVRPVLTSSENVRQRSNTISELSDVQCRKEIVKIIHTPKLQRSMSPRMREVDHHHQNHNLDGATTTTTSNNRLDNNNTDSNSKHNNSCSSTQPDSQCTAVLYGAEFTKPGLSRSSSLTSDEGVIIDRSTHNTLTQDTLEIKFLLLKLRRVLQEVEGVDGGLPTKLLESVLSPDNESSIHEENMDLKRQVTLLQQQVEERDRRLRQLEMEAMTRSSHTPTRSNNNLTKNAAIQTERVRPVSCGSIGQDGLISYNSESSLPTKPPTPSRPTPPSYSTYSRRMLSKSRPSTPRYHQTTNNHSTSSSSSNTVPRSNTNTSNTLPRSPSASRYTARIIDSPSGSVTPTSSNTRTSSGNNSNQYGGVSGIPTTSRPYHYQHPSSITAEPTYSAGGGGGRSMSIPGCDDNSFTAASAIRSQNGVVGEDSNQHPVAGDCYSPPRDSRIATKQRGAETSGGGGGRHTARRAESPRYSSCKSQLQQSGMQIFSGTPGGPGAGSGSTRHNWLNNNILNNNHHQNNSCCNNSSSDNSDNNSYSSSSGGANSNSTATSSTNISQRSRGPIAATTNKNGSKNGGKSGGILRAISAGRLSSKQQHDKYYSTNEGTLCISLHK